jgi:hypothetical protein
MPCMAYVPHVDYHWSVLIHLHQSSDYFSVSKVVIFHINLFLLLQSVFSFVNQNTEVFKESDSYIKFPCTMLSFSPLISLCLIQLLGSHNYFIVQK